MLAIYLPVDAIEYGGVSNMVNCESIVGRV